MKPLSQCAFSVSQQISSVVSVEGVHIPFQLRVTSRCFPFVPSSNMCSVVFRHASLFHILGKNSSPPQALPRPLPVLKPLYRRKAETATRGSEVSSVELSTENFPLLLHSFFTQLVHITHSFVYLS